MSDLDNEIENLEKELDEKKKLKKLINLADGDESMIKISQEIRKLTKEKIDIELGTYDVEKIVKIEDKINSLQEQLISKLTKEKQLAIIIHEKQTNYYYNDDWMYEIKDGLHDWQANTHRKYLEKAKNMLKLSDFNTIVSIIECL